MHDPASICDFQNSTPLQRKYWALLEKYCRNRYEEALLRKIVFGYASRDEVLVYKKLARICFGEVGARENFCLIWGSDERAFAHLDLIGL